MCRIPTVSLLLVFALSVSAQESKDPFQWLEDVTGEKSLAWVKERNAKSTGELAKTAEFKALDDRLLKILDSKDRIPLISKNGPWYYNFWRDEKNKRGLWRRTTLDEYRKEKPNWETVLDLDALAEEEKENWVWHGANFLQPKYERCLISLSRGGADADGDPRVRRDRRRRSSRTASRCPEAKSRVSWRDTDTSVRRHRFRPGLADHVGLSAHRPRSGSAARRSRTRRWSTKANRTT